MRNKLWLPLGLLALGLAWEPGNTGTAQAQLRNFNVNPKANPANIFTLPQPKPGLNPAINNPGLGNPAPAFNPQNMNPGLGNPGFDPYGFNLRHALSWQLQQSQHLDYLFYGNSPQLFNNPNWYFSPIVSQYGYYGNPWGPFPNHPAFGHQFGPWMNNGPMFPWHFYPQNPFMQQGPFNANGGGMMLNNPANIFK